MSVTSSAATVGPPSILFGQRSSSPPSFASPPRSETPVASPPESQDVDMSASSTLPPPRSQNHDRNADALMQDGNTLANGHADTIAHASIGSDLPAPGIAVQIAAVDDDAMDTSPDSDQDLVLPNGAPFPPEARTIAAPVASDHAIEGAPGAITGNEVLPPPADTERAEADSVPPVGPTPPADLSLVSPPPPPPPPPPPLGAIRSDSESSDDDDAEEPWHPLHEDISAPDDAEIKEIEEAGEHSALEHEYWWGNGATPVLTDPEHRLGARGVIEWTIDNYNGTRENPNKEVVMRSEPAIIGGHEWRIKFYPKGNNSDYLSIYIECLSVSNKAENRRSSVVSGSGHGSDDAPSTAEITRIETGEVQHTPLPLIHVTPPRKRKSVAAHISVVLYNPSEPRVNHFKMCNHRFCSKSPDWGWTRYHGPYTEIPYRMRGQRQALLRGDRLALTAYVQIVEDDTGCLWEHANHENPWDSFAMTGLQSLALGECVHMERAPSGGNLISAIASWMLFKPFRQFLYSYELPDPNKEPFARPRPLITALQKILYLLRTQVHSGLPVTIEDVLDALDWYGVTKRMDKLDVIRIWEVLRSKLEDELRDTTHADALDNLFGLKKNFTPEPPRYRVPVLGVGSMQEAIDRAPDYPCPSSAMPQLLTIELERQHFDEATRSYMKLINKVSLDESITVRQTPYTLYGCIVHRQNLQSYLYHPVLRPEGRGSRWYSYTDDKEDNRVRCLTHREAVTQHEGKPGPGKISGNESVAYIALYVRADVAQSAFDTQADSEDWDIRNEHTKQWKKALSVSAEDPIPSRNVHPETGGESAPAEHVDIRVIDSRAFSEHIGPGIFNAYDPKWNPSHPTRSEHVHSVRLEPADTCQTIRTKLAAVLPAVRDVRQIKFWFVDPLPDLYAWPRLHGTGLTEYSCDETIDRSMGRPEEWRLKDSSFYSPAYSIWAHIVDFADLPEPPKEPSGSGSGTSAHTNAPERGATENQSLNSASIIPREPSPRAQAEDTPMSDPDEPSSPALAPHTAAAETRPVPVDGSSPTSPSDQNVSADTAMLEVEEVAASSVVIAVPPTAEAVVPVTLSSGDIDMSGIPVPYAVPPPPLFSSSHVNPHATQLTPEALQPDEMYFFLKMFDADSQTLRSCGFHIASMSAKLDATVCSKLGLPATDTSYDYAEEVDLLTANSLRGRRSFITNGLHQGSVIIVFKRLTEAQREALADRGDFADIQAFFKFCALERNSPGKLNGHFTKDYFSSQYYKGEINKGKRHGHGTRIYHNGATYSGSFRMGQRHGHGFYTFQNGDTYDGDWFANQQHGSGTFVEASTGNKYVGDWKNDKKFGEGVTHWKKAQEAERLCRICWCDNADAAFYDCGHVVACLPCAKQMNTCPVCRKRVISAMKLYYVV